MTGPLARVLTSARLALAAVGVAVIAAGGVATVAAGPAQAAGPRPNFQLPVPCGETWRLATYYGHDDYDIDLTFTGGASNGRPVLASYGGTVAFAGWGSGGGWHVIVEHGGGWRTLYLHMIETPMVATGQWVATGQQLGRVGSTGNSTGPHLHYEQVRDGVKTESYFDGVPSGITSDGSPSTGPLYVSGPTSPARNMTSRNCGQAANRQVYESGSHSGWQMLPVNSITGSATASMVMGGNKLLYTVNNGLVYEASSDTGWRNLWTGISGVSDNALAVISVDGVKYIYTVVGGWVHEANSINGWRNLNSGVSGVSPDALAAISFNGVKIIYTVAGGMVHEAASNNGWRNLNSGVRGTAVSATSISGVKVLYTV